MASRFNSTVFGQLMRLLSGNRLFQYSDEIDPSLWKTAIQPDTAQASSLGEDIGSTEKADSHIVGLHNDGIEHDKRILLVSWYGSDDPEVCPALPNLCDYVLISLESPELPRNMEVRHFLPDVHPQLCRLYCKLYLCSRRARRHGRIWCQPDCSNTWTIPIHHVRVLRQTK